MNEEMQRNIESRDQRLDMITALLASMAKRIDALVMAAERQL